MASNPMTERKDLPPLLVRPRYVPKIWGGRRLETVLGRRDLPAGKVGESWEAGVLEEWDPEIEAGPLAGRRLGDVWGGPFPLLVKVIDAQENLSVQVHPDGWDRGLAAKEEIWATLADGGHVALGTVSGEVPAPRSWLRALVRTALHPAHEEVPPSLVHVPPGLVHAILAGSLLWEVQTPVDVTWRLDDYGRLGLDGKPRTLHLEEARGVLERGSERRAAPSVDGRRLDGIRFWVEAHPPGSWPGAGGALVALLPGGGRVTWGAGEALEVPPGRTVVLPGAVETLESDGWILAAGGA